MNNSNIILLSVLFILIFVFGVVAGLNAPIKNSQEIPNKELVTLEELDELTSYDPNMVSMSLVRANQMNRNTTTIWDAGNDTIYVNMTLTKFGDTGISHNTKLILTKNGIVYEPVNFAEFIKTGYICRKNDTFNNGVGE